MNEATSSSATPRTKATAKTTAKAAATKTTRTAAKSTAKTTTKKPTTKRTSKPKTATKRTVGETPAPIINRTSPEQFGRVNVLGITPSAENGLYPARVELGEAFKVTAQVFIEGRTKAGATVSVRNTRGTEKARFPMTCTNPGLDRWEAMVKIGDHSDLKPWEDGYADVKKQLGEWHIVVEGWEDTYASWLHDAQIKVEVGDDVENALESGAQLLERWAGARDSKLTADDKKTLREAAKTVADKSLDATARLAAATTDAIASLHETNPLRDGLSASNPQRFRVERPKSSFAAWYQFFPRSEGAYFDADGKIVQGTLKTALSGLDRAKAEGFDIVYLPPIFPIGVTNRKGRNNTLIAGPHDPGSPFGIGSELGGHDTVDPLLGTMDDFKAFCAHAQWHSTSRCSARLTTRGSSSIRTGSAPSRTERSHSPRIRRRSTRTSIRSISTPTWKASKRKPNASWTCGSRPA